MPEHPNVQRLRAGYEAYGKGDLATLRGLCADDVAFHFLGHNPLSGDYHGLGEVLGYFERLRASGARFTFDVHSLLADGEHGVGLLTGTAERAGRRVEQKVVHVFHLNAEGKVSGWWNFWEDQAALDELLA